MIVRDFNELKNTSRAVQDARWTSVRMLLADDGMGFSFHITTLEAGSEHTFEYKHHFESVYCMAGKGSITDLATGETHQIRPGVMRMTEQEPLQQPVILGRHLDPFERAFEPVDQPRVSEEGGEDPRHRGGSDGDEETQRSPVEHT